MTDSVPNVPAQIRAETYYKLIEVKRQRDPTLSKTAAAVLEDPTVTVYLSDLNGWELRDPLLYQQLPRQVTRLMLYGKVDLSLLSAFPGLQRLSLSGTIQNWQALALLPELRVLDLSLVRIPDLRFLGASKLEVLNGSNCHLQTLDNLEQLRSLRQLDLHLKVKDANEWQALAALDQLERAEIRTYSPVHVPDLRGFRHLRYLSISAPEIRFDPSTVMAAPALEALALDGAPFLFMASPQGVRPGAPAQWLATLQRHKAASPLLRSSTLKRVCFGDLPASERQALANWLQVPCVREPEQLWQKHFIPRYDDKAEARAAKQFDTAVKAIQKRVKQAIGQKCVIQFSAYEVDAVGLPVDNLDQVCFEGACRVEHETEHADPFHSAVLQDPTWLDLACIANAMILSTNAKTDHKFLEGIDVVRRTSGITVLRLLMGS